MKARKVLPVLVAGVMWSIVPVTSAAENAASAAPIRVFDAGEITPGGYTVVKRLWVGTWRSAFWIGTHHDAAAAIAALTSEAAGVGANAVTNLYCVNDANAWFGSGYLCYGLAIKLR